MISLKAIDIFWINEVQDDPEDQCVHGFVDLIINDKVFVSKSSGEFTLSAASLFLLRTIFEGHTQNNSVTDGEFLFPCCGFSIFKSKIRADAVYILGCPNGLNLDITHHNKKISISNDVNSEQIPLLEYCKAVVGFSEKIYDSYLNSSPKDSDDDNEWDLFWSEWKSLMIKSKKLISLHSK